MRTCTCTPVPPEVDTGAVLGLVADIIAEEGLTGIAVDRLPNRWLKITLSRGTSRYVLDCPPGLAGENHAFITRIRGAFAALGRKPGHYHQGKFCHV